MQSNNKAKLPKPGKKRSAAPVETSITFKLDDELKKRFLAALEKGRPSTYTLALKGLIVAYVEATARDGKQPEFPLEVRSKVEKR